MKWIKNLWLIAKKVTAIDARPRACHRRHDMAAGLDPFTAPHPPLKKFIPISKLFLIWV